MAIDVATARISATGTWGVLRGAIAGWIGPRGLIRIVLWAGALNGIVYFTVVTKHMPFGGLGYETLVNMLAVVPPLAAVIATESMILGEHRSGIASWTISKPVPRSGYVIGKLLGLWFGMSVAAVVIPGLVAFWWLPNVTPYRFVAPEAPPMGRFLGVLLALCLIVGFFIMLTAFLATVLRRRGAVAFIGLITYLLLRNPLRNLWSDWDRFTPSGLISNDLTGWSSLTSLLYGEPFTGMNAVVWTAVVSAVFLAGSIVVYRRLEL